jgi:thioredoxin-like negative regulator of GroEL
MNMSRLDTFRSMVATNPGNAIARFGLATEAAKDGLWAEAAEHFQIYLASYDDEGNGYARYAEALIALDRVGDARDALNQGIQAAHRFGHPGLAAELVDRLAELEPTT